MRATLLSGIALSVGLLGSGVETHAQEVLPVPPAPFKDEIGLSAKESKSDFPQPVQAPKGAPNPLLALLDDVQGCSSCGASWSKTTGME